MDIITNKSAVTPQMHKQEIRPAEAVPLGRPVGRVAAPVEQAQPQAREFSQQDMQSLEDAVASMQGATQALQRDLNFSIDDSTGRMVVKVTDSASGEIIRQMPTEEALRLAESLDEMRSLLFTAEA